MGMVQYQDLSPRILKEISTMEANKASLIGHNDIALLIDKFESEGNEIYYTNLTYYTASLSVKCDTGTQAEKILKWFGENGFRYESHEDSEWNSTRTYRLVSTISQESLDALGEEAEKISLKVYFDSGSCQFVSEPTGKFVDVPEVVGAAAHREQEMRKILKCGTAELPTVV